MVEVKVQIGYGIGARTTWRLLCDLFFLLGQDTWLVNRAPRSVGDISLACGCLYWYSRSVMSMIADPNVCTDIVARCWICYDFTWGPKIRNSELYFMPRLRHTCVSLFSSRFGRAYLSINSAEHWLLKCSTLDTLSFVRALSVFQKLDYRIWRQPDFWEESYHNLGC